jgi:predicted DNA binding protein
MVADKSACPDNPYIFGQSCILLQMRRLVIEIEAAEFARLAGEGSLDKIESLEVLNFIKEDPEEFVTLCRVVLKGSSTFDEVFTEAGTDVQVIDRDKAGRYTAIFKGRPRQDPMLRGFLTTGGYLSTPLEIRGGKVRVTFVGTPREVRRLLAMVRAEVRRPVVRVTDASLSSGSPLNRLTTKQRQVIRAAYELGYYDAPKKINTQRLAARLKISGSTLAMHRIKAERRLLKEILDG